MMNLMHTNNFLFQIVRKEIQKYDKRKFYFFSEKKHFQNRYSRSSLKKKNAKKIKNVFFYRPKLQKKNSQ